MMYAMATLMLWAGLLFLIAAAAAAVADTLSRHEEARDERDERDDRRAELRARAQREAWALDYDWQEQL